MAFFWQDAVGGHAPMRFLARAAGGVLLTSVLAAGTAGAQPAPASPTPAAVPSGFSARAHANLSVVVQGTTYTGAVQLAVAQRGELTRLDVLSVQSDAFPVPPLTGTVVVDRRANTFTVWNDTTRQYRIQALVPRVAGTAAPRKSAPPKATPAPRSGSPRNSPFAKLELLEVTLRLTGHTTTAGLPTTGLAFDLQVRKTGDQAASHISATTQLADDFAAFPVTLELSVEPGATPFGAKLAYAVDDFTRALPPPGRFVVPAGYKEARSLLSVIFPQGVKAAGPSRSPAPLPTASP